MWLQGNPLWSLRLVMVALAIIPIPMATCPSSSLASLTGQVSDIAETHVSLRMVSSFAWAVLTN